MRNTALRAGEWVEVRSKEEILATLDKTGQLEGLPFMPEMFEFCGKRFRVFKRAHKTCDPPNGMGGRGMSYAVHLEDIRCTGDAHGGCQARCLMFWKEAWLKRVDQPAGDLARSGAGCTEQDVIAGTRRAGSGNSDEPLYACQSTQLAQATYPLRWWDVRQYLEDYTSGNVKLSRLVSAFLFCCYDQLVSSGLGFGSALRWTYDVFQKVRGGTPFPKRLGKVEPGQKTPSAKLELRPGEVVRTRKYEDILVTLDEAGNNRGMSFDPEMVPFCGNTYRVLDRVTHIINEKTGKMQHLKNDCIMLDEVVCLACYAKYRRFCPRSIHPYWREIWLERAATNCPNAAEHTESRVPAHVSN